MKLRALHTLYRLSLAPKLWAFDQALQNPWAAQEQILRQILQRNARTRYGQQWGFSGMGSVDQYRKKVPLITYDDISPYIEAMKNGETDVLTTEQVKVFEKTSGSAAATKYIPLTPLLLSEIHNATSVWLHDLYTAQPALRRTTAYWAISSRTGNAEQTHGGIPIGMADDTGYFSPFEQWFMQQVFAVDPRIAGVQDSSQWKKLTCLYLLADENLGLISVWSPTFLILLCRYMEEHWDELLAALTQTPLPVPVSWKKPRISRRRERALAAARRGPAIDFKHVWPCLQLVSTWKDGSSRNFIPELEQLLPGVAIQGKGLLMTEGIISFPLQHLADPVLAIRSHFYEFLPVNNGDSTVLPEEVKKGSSYIPVITTSGGLYRYKTGDQVEVTGFANRVPLLRFISRCDRVSDLFGEKLSEAFVHGLLQDARRELAVPLKFFMLAPREGIPGGYVLYVEAQGALDEQALATAVEQRLQENHQYAYCRRLGQLAALRVERITGALQTYERVMVEVCGQQRGAVKFPSLDTRTFWSACFQKHNNSTAM
jgi:hypothetical protein